MAVHKCYAFRLKRKNLLSSTPDACSPLLASSAFIGAGQQGQLLGVSGTCRPAGRNGGWGGIAPCFSEADYCKIMI